MARLQVEIVTPTRVAFSDEAQAVRAPGFNGEFGVLPQHTLFLGVIKPGVVVVSTVAGDRRFVVGDGFAEVGPDRVQILSELVELPEEIDRAKAREALKKAELSLLTVVADTPEHKQVVRAIALNNARLAI